MSEARVSICLPALLADLAGGERRIEVSGDTLRLALDDLLRKRPALRLHLVDEAGAFRRHIRFFCNDAYTRSELDVPIRPGDTITILHSVSGG